MSFISKEARISRKAKIGINVIIMDRVVISAGTEIRNNVVIYPDTFIDKDVLILDNCVLGRTPFMVANLDRKPKKRLAGLRIGKGCRIGASVVLYRGSKIGNNVMICDFSSVREECSIGDNAVLARGVFLNYHVKIGRNSRIMDGCNFGGDMVVEENVFMGSFVCSANDKFLELKGRTSRTKGAHIKKGARIGLGCILLSDITIGENSFIGAGALVNKDIPGYSLAYGFPVRIIRKLK